MKALLKVLDTVAKFVKLTVRKLIAWEPLFNVTRKRASRKTLVEYSMQKGAIELDGSGYHILKLERPQGLSSNGYKILIDNKLVCEINDEHGKVYFPESTVKNNYELVEHVRKILRNLSKGGLKLNESFREYFESKDSDESRYDRSYESNIQSHLAAVGWQIF